MDSQQAPPPAVVAAVPAGTAAPQPVHAVPEPVAAYPAGSVVAGQPVGVPAVQAAKEGAASPHVEGTGVSHVAVANELGVATKTREDHEREQELPNVPTRPQDMDTGTFVKQQEAAAEPAIDPETYNVWTHPDEIPKELVKGLDNEELFKLVRRFNKQMYHVKATSDGTKRGSYPELEMDLVNASDEEFSPDRLRSNLERLYITFVIGTAGFVKHIARIRSWNEFNRTASWCTVYFTFWLFGQVGLLLSGLLVVLIVYPPARPWLFPPAPLAMVSATSGGLQKPKAGDTLGSKDSLTGAPEAHKGEAVENEATNFVNGIASVAVATAINKSPEKQPDESSAKTKIDGALPDPTSVIVGGGDALNKAAGLHTDEHAKKAKDPVVESIWKAMRPAMRGIEDFCDNYERFGNALSPTPPYPEHGPRLKLAAALLPVILITVFVPVQWLAHGASFGAGVAFFSQPYMTRAWTWFTTKFPDWMELLQIQKTLLKGVPSNSQLTLTLLRYGEEHNTPLPPPPQYDAPPVARTTSPVIEDDLPPVNPDTAERDLSHDHEYIGDEEKKAVVEDNSPTGDHKTHKKHRVLGFLRGAAKTTVTTVLGADRVKAQAGSTKSKQRQGVLRHRQYIDGPSMFKCRYDGKKGWAIISTSATTPCISFVRDNKLPGTAEFDPKLSVQIGEIKELKKLGGLGWKTKLIVGGVLGMEVIDALTIITTTGEAVTLTALPRRDEMFNRLVALSPNVSFYDDSLKVALMRCLPEMGFVLE